MKKLVIHVGPGKCGSSSIQSFFKVNKKPCLEKVNFNLMKIKDIDNLNVEELSKDLIEYYTRFLKTNIKKFDVLIISHEYLFQCPLAIKQLCSLGDGLSIETCIIGYSRRQSDFIISAYAQWIFRSKDVIQEVNEILHSNNINPILFDGLEKTIIAAIIADFKIAKSLFKIDIFNWNASYKNIKTLTLKYKTSVKSGTLPKLHDKVNLIEDFCLKANITLKDSSNEKTGIRDNTKFHPMLVEGIH